MFSTFGVWVGFNYPLSLKREGISRFLFYLIKHLLINYPLNCEIWCYDINVKEIRDLFKELLADATYADRLNIFTEGSFLGTRRNRLTVFQEGMDLAKGIILGGTHINWKSPYKYYRFFFGATLQGKERDLLKGQGSELRYLPVDVVLSVLLILAGFISRGLSKMILNKMILPLLRTKTVRILDAAQLPFETGHMVEGRRVAEEGRDKSGAIIYGPYLKLSPGYHEVRIWYSWSEERTKTKGQPLWDIAFNLGRDVIANGKLPKGTGQVLRRGFWVEMRHCNAPMEFRIWYGGCGRLEIEKLEIKGKGESKDILAVLANGHSQSDCMLIPIVTLYNAKDIQMKRIISIHDLAVLEYYDYFYQEQAVDIYSRKELVANLQQFSEQGCFFCSNSDYVRRHHTLQYIPNTNTENTGFVYLPLNVPEIIHDKILAREEIYKKYGISERYLFYPTQLRPYKNVITLLKALKILVAQGIPIHLVLTGKLKHLPSVHRYAHENHLQSHIVQTGDVPEADLFALHKYAAATVVPTLFEGGFPWQGMEAMFMDTPAIMSRIPVVVERIRSIGLDPERCGLKLFDPEDAQELALIIIEGLRDRQRIVEEQSLLKMRLLSYNWDDVSRQYYDLLSKV